MPKAFYYVLTFFTTKIVKILASKMWWIS